MNRMQLLRAFSYQLQGVARYARAGNCAVSDYFILYLRQALRHYCRDWRDSSAVAFGEWLASGGHFYGNRMLRAMDKDHQPGGGALKGQVAQCILDGHVISTTLFKDYRRFFKPAHLEGPDQRRYNTDLLAKAVGEAFLFSLEPANGIAVPAYGWNMSTGEITPMGTEVLSQRDLTRHYIREALERSGVYGDPQLNDCGLDFDFRFAFGGLHRVMYLRGRFGLHRYLRQEEREEMVKLSRRMERYEKRVKKRENIQ